MKNSIKISVLTVTLVSAIMFSVNAQTKSTSGFKLSIGPEFGLPIGSTRDVYGYGLGGSVQAEYPIVNDQLFVVATAGYSNYHLKSQFQNSFSNLQLLPVKAGLKYFLVGNLYVQGEAGVSFLLNKKEAGYQKTSSFQYAPQIGYEFKLANKNYIDAGIKFESNTSISNNNFNTLGLRLAYGFGL